MTKANYTCSCYAEYPNEAHRRNNGKWKCVDRYEPGTNWEPRYVTSCRTHCRRKQECTENAKTTATA